MSNSGLAEKFIKATHYSNGRSGRNIEKIAIHHMAGVLSVEQCGSIFQGNRQASSHYGIGNDGRIAQYVDEADTAWTNSHWDSNCKSVTIETSNCEVGGNWAVSDVALNSLIRLVADIAKRNNIILEKEKTVVWHSMYVATTCPGPYLLGKIDYIIEEANKINNVQTNIVEEKRETVVRSNEEVIQEVIQGKWGVGQDRKNRLINAGYDYNTIQNLVNEKLLGKKTYSTAKTVDELAREVIAGKWGIGQDRKNMLINAGYNYYEIQARVNQILK